MNSILLISNQSYFIHTFAMLCSLFENNAYPINVYLMESDIKEADIRVLERFVELWPDKRLIPIHMDTDRLRGLYTTEALPAEVYFRITGLDLIDKDINQILAIDLDMSVKGNIGDIFKTDLGDRPLAACKDIFAYVFKNTAETNIKRLGLPTEHTYFNGGFLLMNLDRIRADGGSRYIMDKAQTVGPEKLLFLEQDLLNYVYHKEYLEVDWAKYNCPPIKYVMKKSEVDSGILRPLYDSEISQMDSDGYMDYTQAIYDNARVIHYLGAEKPWLPDRPDVPTFKIFDRAYIYYSNKAASILEKMYE